VEGKTSLGLEELIRASSGDDVDDDVDDGDDDDDDDDDFHAGQSVVMTIPGPMMNASNLTTSSACFARVSSV
jgi:hypothetical protein